jgi:hypothetical protein
MRRLRETDCRSTTGVVGISIQTTFARRNRTRAHRFFVVRWCHDRKPGCKRFNIDTLGKSEAWRRALRLRAEHELSRRTA